MDKKTIIGVAISLMLVITIVPFNTEVEAGSAHNLDSYLFNVGEDWSNAAAGPADFADASLYLMNKDSAAAPTVNVTDLVDAMAGPVPAFFDASVGTPWDWVIDDPAAIVYEVYNGLNGYVGTNYSGAGFMLLTQLTPDFHGGAVFTEIPVPTDPSSSEETSTLVLEWDGQASIHDPDGMTGFVESNMLVDYAIYNNIGGSMAYVGNSTVSSPGATVTFEYSLWSSAPLGDWDFQIAPRYKGPDYDNDPSSLFETTARSEVTTFTKSGDVIEPDEIVVAVSENSTGQTTFFVQPGESITLYASGYNNSNGYRNYTGPLGDSDWSGTGGTWSPTSGGSSMFTATLVEGNYSQTCDDTVNELTYDFHINVQELEVDYILVTDAPDATGQEITTVEIPILFLGLEVYANGYSNIGDTWIKLIDVNWTQGGSRENWGSQDTSTGNYYAGEEPGIYTQVAKKNGTTFEDTFEIQILRPTPDFVTVTDAPDGNEISLAGVIKTTETEFFASGYNESSVFPTYAGLVDVEWSGTGGSWGTVFGNSSVFTAGSSMNTYAQNIYWKSNGTDENHAYTHSNVSFDITVLDGKPLFVELFEGWNLINIPGWNGTGNFSTCEQWASSLEATTDMYVMSIADWENGWVTYMRRDGQTKAPLDWRDITNFELDHDQESYMVYCVNDGSGNDRKWDGFAADPTSEPYGDALTGIFIQEGWNNVLFPYVGGTRDTASEIKSSPVAPDSGAFTHVAGWDYSAEGWHVYSGSTGDDFSILDPIGAVNGIDGQPSNPWGFFVRSTKSFMWSPTA